MPTYANVQILPDKLPEFVMMKDVLAIVNRLFRDAVQNDNVHWVLDCSEVRDFSSEALVALSRLRRFHLHAYRTELTLRNCSARIAEVTRGPLFRELMELS